MSQTQAFQGLAGNYHHFRPDYPEEILNALRTFFMSTAERLNSATIVDVGAGTGISTRLLRQMLGENYKIVGVEPGAAMLRQAVENTSSELGITYLEASAEKLPFPDHSVAMVVAAQALQWFDRERFYVEVSRVLESQGTLAVMQNNRWWQESAFLAAYEEFLETNNPGYSRGYRDFDVHAELESLSGFVAASPVIVRWTRNVSPDDFIGMSFSSTRTKPIVQRLGEERAAELLRKLIERFFPGKEQVEVLYRTELYCARRL